MKTNVARDITGIRDEFGKLKTDRYNENHGTETPRNNDNGCIRNTKTTGTV